MDIFKAHQIRDEESTDVSTRGTIHDQRDVSQGCLN